MPKLLPSIDALFEDPKITETTAQKLLDICLNNLENSERIMFSRFSLMLVIWIVTIGISQGLISDASFLGVKVKDMTVVLPVFPLIIAISYYGMMASIASLGRYIYATRQIIKHHWKKIYENELADLILPPTFLMNEIFMLRSSEENNRLINMWNSVLILVLLAIPLVWLIHSIYISVMSASLSFWFTIPVTIVCLIFVVRSFMLLFHESQYSGEYETDDL